MSTVHSLLAPVEVGSVDDRVVVADIEVLGLTEIEVVADSDSPD